MALMEWEEEAMTDELNIDTEVLRRAFKPESIRYRDGGGGRKLAYLDGATVIRRLNEACREWHFEVVAEESRPIMDARNTSDYPTLLMIAHGRMTIPGLGTRDGIGVQEVKPNSGVDFNKGHYTDALKKCATLFGVGLELYGDDTEADEQPARMAPQERAQVEEQHRRNTQPASSRLPVTRSPAGQRQGAPPQQPDGQDRARQNIEAKCAARGIPVLPVDTYEVIAETVNRALLNAGKDIEVQTDRNGKVTPGAILNALLALPSAVPA
jgi:recombination DNA repair RAD52 pathway protein